MLHLKDVGGHSGRGATRGSHYEPCYPHVNILHVHMVQQANKVAKSAENMAQHGGNTAHGSTGTMGTCLHKTGRM